MAQRFLTSIRNQWIGVLALFLVLTGGTALALTRNSVGSAQLKPNSVKASETAPHSVGSPEVTNGSLLGEDFAPGEVVGSEPWHDVGAEGEPGFNQAGTTCAWRNYPPPGFNPAGFFRDRAGVVHLRGLVQVYDNDGACDDFLASDFRGRIFTLPQGYGPEGFSLFPGVSGPGGFARIDVWANGEVHVAANVDTTDAKEWVSVEGISFRCGPAGVNGCP